ncbi:MAG: alpha/beta fold hydrolase, partial [Alphaproteobacteria bacterium]|nr:alpha/beta fold hydrolase [Alphaproteobacteria bacterium]
MLSDETRIVVPAGGGRSVYAILSRSAAASGRVVLAVHGLAGQPDDFLLRHSRDRFLADGFDVCRPALYSWQRDARDLRDTTLVQHAADLRAVHAHLAGGWRSIYLVGHSYGGIALVLAALNGARALSLWDSLFSPARLWRDVIACEPAAGPDYLELRDPLRVQIGRAMRTEGLGLTAAAMRAAATAVT